jgi:vacuolar-type H+-ATPase subunit E/Vma4
MLDEAHAEARRIRREASADLERMRSESRRIRSLLGAALATLEADNGADESEAKAA